MSFLSKLGEQVSQQASLGENTNKTIDLGAFSEKVDKSAQRSYVEEGYLRRDPYNATPKQFDLLIQEPQATILVKKKMFSSIGENFRPDFMDAEEKLYYKTMKVLFQNKCNQVAALEKLSKIQKVSEAAGNINQQLMPIIFGLSDVISNGFASGNDMFGTLGGGNPFEQKVSKFSETINNIKKIYAYNAPAQTTSWITDSTNLLQSQFGQGTGVIEITNFTDFNTTTSIDLSPSSMNITISDPYSVMLITEWDIEKAIADANNFFNNSQLFQFGKDGADDVVAKAKAELNNVRALRKASPISFKLNPDTLIGKKVVAIIDRQGLEIIFDYDSSGGIFPGLGGVSNKSVHVNGASLKDSVVSGFDGLDPKKSTSQSRNKNAESELSIFKRLICAIYNKMQLEANSRNAMIQNNEATNGIRRELRFNFLSKLIIQEMDPIHVYINSKARYDNKILSGLNSMMSGVGVLSNINNTITDFQNTAESLFNPGSSIPTQIEKSIYVGDNFPNFLWNILRDQFISEKEGTHVYAGIVRTAETSWSQGSSTVTIEALDNAEYFNMGQVNFKPSVDTYNGSIYDPLTPFKSNVDDIGGWTKKDFQLLDENKSLLDAKILKKKYGPNAGHLAQEVNLIEDSSVDKNTGLVTRVAHMPDGLSYKWKKGIGVFTQYSKSLEVNDETRVGTPNIFAEPFAGLDVMNTLSLLIVGAPYNFETYFNSGVDSGLFKNDNQSKENAATSFLSVLRSGLQKSNSLWGNFIPFKNLVVDEKSYEKMMASQLSVSNQNADIENKLNKLRDLNDAAALAGAVNILSVKEDTGDSKLSQIASEIKRVSADIEKAIRKNLSSEKDINAQAAVISSVDSKQNSVQSRRFLRKKMNLLTRRMSYEVRANTDKNLFIVDDNYDKDYDIMAYNKALEGNIGLMDNSYTNTSEKISTVSNLLDMEVFCDTQGHIRARFPQYNRMPSSIFHRMIHLKNSSGVELYPKFLSDFFQDQIGSLKSRIEATEDKIRIDCAVLGHFTDSAAVAYLTSGNNTSGLGDDFKFLSNSEGVISKIDELLASADKKEQDQSINNFSDIKSQSESTKIQFSSSKKYEAILQSLTDEKLKAEGINIGGDIAQALASNEYIKVLISRVKKKTSTTISISDYIEEVGKGSFRTTRKRINIFAITKKIQETIKERQSFIKMFYGTIKNAIEYRSIDKDGAITSKLLPSGNFDNSNIPEVYEHMIEDESFDDLGFSSGGRYIIKNTQIKSLRINNRKPDYTSIKVSGIVSDFDIKADSFNVNSSNSLTTATAVDYDMWRRYGFTAGQTVTLPFLNNAETQSAPYASMLLNRARKNTIRGNVDIVGNEYMQPGEVVYLEDRGMLFYVNSVRHSFSYKGTSFTTSLDLTYGHTPGEYIPTFLDMIGKVLYKNRDVADIAIQRQGSFLNQSNLGSLTLTKDGEISSNDINIISNMMYIAKYKLSGTSETSDIITKLELRVYYDSSTTPPSGLSEFANKARDIMIGKEKIANEEYTDDQKNSFNEPIDEKLVVVKYISLDMDDNPYSPSQKAIDAAKNLVGSNAKSFSFTNPFASKEKKDPKEFGKKTKQALYENIVDCWISITAGK